MALIRLFSESSDERISLGKKRQLFDKIATSCFKIQIFLVLLKTNYFDYTILFINCDYKNHKPTYKVFLKFSY